MCHGAAVSAFPDPTVGDDYHGDVRAYVYGDASASKKIAILPDIYGCNPFYQGMALRYVDKGAQVFLVDTFDGLGDLPEMTTQAAYDRRMKVRDNQFLDAVEHFATSENITGIAGFCLGGLYIFDLARRGVNASLVGLYGFPQGLPNDDPLDAPFDYLKDVTHPFTMLMGRADTSVTTEVVDALSAMAPDCPAMDLTVYQTAGHGFLPDLSSDDASKRAIAEDALKRMDGVLL